MSAKDAGNCFLTNFRLVGDPNTDPEKYNLYKGLIDLAAAVEKIENDLTIIKDFMAVMKSKSLAVHI